jgi:hypothetical protein
MAPNRAHDKEARSGEGPPAAVLGLPDPVTIERRTKQNPKTKKKQIRGFRHRSRAGRDLDRSPKGTSVESAHALVRCSKAGNLLRARRFTWRALRLRSVRARIRRYMDKRTRRATLP